MAYNGWSNYETWRVNLWLDNEPGTYEDKRDIIRDAGDKHTAAHALRDYVGDNMIPDHGGSLAGDLIGAALSEVNWLEIVESDWDELHPDDDEQEEKNE